jgi:hypothetical protein
VQNIAINTNQTYQNEGKDTIAQANLDISAIGDDITIHGINTCTFFSNDEFNAAC